MLSGGTVKDIFLSITDDDIRGACKKYPEEKYNFEGAASYLIEMKDRIRRVFSVYDSIQGSPDRDLLGKLLDSAVQQFRGIFDSVRNYSIESEKYTTPTQVHDKISNRIRSYIESSVTRGRLESENQNGPANNLLDAYFLALQLEPKPIPSTKPELTKKDIDDAVEAKNKSQEILNEAKRLLGPESIANYAEYFARTARENSRRNSDSKKPDESWWHYKTLFWHCGFMRGAAQRFLFAAIILVIVGIVFVIVTHSTKAIIVSGSVDPDALSHLVERILGVLLIAYLIRLCFKQYSIRKHLYNLNKHRANTLNSFKLLYNIAPENAPVRSDLLLLVAAGVYEAGESGYLTDKTIDEHILPTHQLAQSIIEKAIDRANK